MAIHEYKLIVRFDTTRLLTPEEQSVIRTYMDSTLEGLNQVQFDYVRIPELSVMLTKLLNVNVEEKKK